MEEIEAVERDLTRVAVGLERVVVEALGDKVLALEAQLRWDDYVESLSPEEWVAMVERNKQALLAKD